MKIPTRLDEYPWVVVRIECTLCDRKGSYRLARLAVRYGANMPLDRLLADLAHTCPYWTTKPRKYSKRCGARFVDLDRDMPALDMPPERPVVRQKPPAREDVAPAPSERIPPPPFTLVPRHDPRLLEWRDPEFAVACQRCAGGLWQTFLTADLVAWLGDVTIKSTLQRVFMDCRLVVGGFGSCLATVASIGDEPAPAVPLPRLADWPDPEIAMACRRCVDWRGPRTETYQKGDLLARFGDAPIVKVLDEAFEDCKGRKIGWDRCWARIVEKPA